MALEIRFADRPTVVPFSVLPFSVPVERGARGPSFPVVSVACDAALALSVLFGLVVIFTNVSGAFVWLTSSHEQCPDRADAEPLESVMIDRKGGTAT